MDKKAQYSAFEIIIAAVIGLVILFSLFYLGSTRFSEFNKQVDDCATKGGNVESNEGACLAKEGIVIGKLAEAGKVCCLIR